MIIKTFQCYDALRNSCQLVSGFENISQNVLKPGVIKSPFLFGSSISAGGVYIRDVIDASLIGIPTSALGTRIKDSFSDPATRAFFAGQVSLCPRSPGGVYTGVCAFGLQTTGGLINTFTMGISGVQTDPGNQTFDMVVLELIQNDTIIYMNFNGYIFVYPPSVL